jgi:hypothetical protein
MHRMIKHLFNVAIGILASPLLTFADSALRVSWDANTENDLAGYRVYYGLSAGKYENVITIGNATSQTIGNLSGGSTYYFVITALDQAGNESRPSQELSVAIPADVTPAPIAAPVVSQVMATNLTASAASIAWSTSHAADSRVEYGLDAAYGSASALDTLLVTAHAVTLSNLRAGTLYHFRVISKDAAGQTATSRDSTFRTLAPAFVGTKPPANLAYRKPVTASSSVGARTPGKATDDSVTTYWRNGIQGRNQTAWLRVDLQSPQTIGRAVIKWRSIYYAKKYDLQVSNDGVRWKVIYSTIAGRGKAEEVSFAAVTARYARLYMHEMNSGNYRINELQLYAGGNAMTRVEPENAEDIEDAEEVEELADSEVDEANETAITPSIFELQQNYPNPFNPRTEIGFYLKNDGHVIINIYNALGQLVRTLYDGYQNAGQHRVVWDARNNEGQSAPSGTYLYTLELKEEIGAGAMTMSTTLARQSRSMTLLK